MRTALAACVPLVVAAACACPPATLSPVEKDAVAAARAWLAKADSGDWAGTWNDATSSFRTVGTAAGWGERAVEARAPYGGFGARTLMGAKWTDKHPARPMGVECVLIKFQTVTEKGKIVEDITMENGKDGVWRVSGYYIDST